MILIQVWIDVVICYCFFEMLSHITVVCSMECGRHIELWNMVGLIFHEYLCVMWVLGEVAVNMVVWTRKRLVHCGIWNISRCCSEKHMNNIVYYFPWEMYKCVLLLLLSYNWLPEASNPFWTLSMDIMSGHKECFHTLLFGSQLDIWLIGLLITSWVMWMHCGCGFGFVLKHRSLFVFSKS